MLFNVFTARGYSLTRYGFPDYQAAADFAAASGKRCHVRLVKYGQPPIYWGPSGRSDVPRWYEGAPQGPHRHKRAVYLTEVEWATAQAFGGGQASDGIQKALAYLSANVPIPDPD